MKDSKYAEKGYTQKSKEENSTAIPIELKDCKKIVEG